MAENSKIEWTDHTFNPWIGCTKVSPGCANCYAETLNSRMKWTEWGDHGKRVRTSESNWKLPLKWNREAKASGIRKKVFCASLADWLDYKAPTAWRRDLLELINATPWLDWQLLTKRPESFSARMHEAMGQGSDLARQWLNGKIPNNVWAGISAEAQNRYDERIRFLYKIPARIRFVSAEPLLGPIDMIDMEPDWLIVGGESGANARPINPEWVRSLRDQCKALTGCAFFFKQWGGVNKKAAGNLLDGKHYLNFPKS